jgi:hypothetical protein
MLTCTASMCAAARPVGFLFADHKRVGLHSYRAHQRTGILDQFEEIHAHENFAAAEDLKEDPGLGQLIQDALDLGSGHFARIVMIQVAVHATLAAAVGHVHLDAQRDA